MEQTASHEIHNPDLLTLIPVESKKIIEIGSSSGALAREFKHISPNSDWVGVEVDASYSELSKRYCDKSLALDIESASENFWKEFSDRDCWIFGDVLEHLKDPWVILKNVRKIIPKNGVIVACIPNMQHWSMIARLGIGDLRYEDFGLLDKTHLRWFTRQTIIEMFDQSGFKIDAHIPRIFNEANRELFLPVIEQIANFSNIDPQIAIYDSLPLQYVVRASLK